MNLSTIAILTLLASSSDSFAPGVPRRVAHTGASQLYADSPSPKTEKEVRNELTKRGTEINDEEKYKVLDGANMAAALTEDATPTPLSVQDQSSLEAAMERLVQPRSYPLFLAEKGIEIVEGALHKIFKSSGNAVNGSKDRVVILGTGWGAAAFLKDVDTNLYDVTVVSPRNFFLFTPMLAGASVGTVEFRSITEPIREINHKANYLSAIATDIDTKTNTVYCQSVVCEGNSCDINDFDIKYDRLIVTVGAQTNTFGIPGVREHCSFLKQVEDARKIRAAIVNCFERANIPGLTDQESVDALTFAVIGAGPTGIEFAAELRDFVEEDGPKYYPNLLKHVRIKVIEAAPTILAPFDKELQDEAIQQFMRPVKIKDEDVQKQLPRDFEMGSLLLGVSVKEVGDKTIALSDGREVRYGLAVWAAGNGPLPFTLQVIDALGEEQSKEQGVARGRLAIDPWLRAVGSEGKVLSFGDCSCITSGQLPATAQVAAQQGEYLAQIMNKKYELSPPRIDGIFPPPENIPGRTETSLSDSIGTLATGTSDFARPFQFLNLGILAYTGGGSALAQVAVAPETDPLKGKGKIGNALWRSVYLSKQISWRNRVLVLNDWVKRRLFGRDITQL